MAMHLEKSTFDIMIDVLQTSSIALAPALAARYINTGDRILDSALIAFITSISTVTISGLAAGLRDTQNFVINFYIALERLKRFCFRLGTTSVAKYGFLNREFPVIDLENSKNRVPVYLNMGKSLTKENYSKIVVWLNDNIPIKTRVPYIEFMASDGAFEPNTGFAKFNKGLIAYPFYHVDSDIVYWDMLNTTTNEIRFSSTSQKALNFFVGVLKSEKLLPTWFDPFSKEEPKSDKPVAAIRRTKIYNYGGGGSLTFMADANVNRSFDSLFFNQKDRLLKMVEKFSTGTLYPKHIHSDNKLGVLLYGPPGTGKSAFVIALANYLHKNIVIVDMTKILTCGEFDNLMNLDKSYILLFEEMDCVLGVLKKRSDGVMSIAQQRQTKFDEEYNALMTLFVNTEDKDEKKRLMDRIDKHKNNKDNALHLGYILQRLDGIFNETGRVIVGCTNHPEQIDPALLRPGRFGIKMELGLCSGAMIEEIITYYMQLDKTQVACICEAGLPAGKFSPAELIQTIQMYYDEEADRDQCLRALLDCLRARCV